jgi:hypothetical protein
LVPKCEGGERRIDVAEFLAITRAIGADPVKLLKSLIRQVQNRSRPRFAGDPSRKFPWISGVLNGHRNGRWQGFLTAIMASRITRSSMPPATSCRDGNSVQSSKAESGAGYSPAPVS